MKPQEQIVNTPINLEGLTLDNPAMMMHPNAFAAHISLSAGVVGAWIDNGYLPTVKIGKYRMINLLKLKEMLSSNLTDITGELSI
jgi:hypothetical protein